MLSCVIHSNWLRADKMPPNSGRPIRRLHGQLQIVLRQCGKGLDLGVNTGFLPQYLPHLVCQRCGQTSIQKKQAIITP